LCKVLKERFATGAAGQGVPRGVWVGRWVAFLGVGGIPDCLAHGEEKIWVKSWKNYKVRQRKKSVAKVEFKEIEEEKQRVEGVGKAVKEVKGVKGGGGLTKANVYAQIHMHSLYLTACIFVYYFSFAICLFFDFIAGNKKSK